MPSKVFTWGRHGINLVASPVHLDDGELLIAQNVQTTGLELEDGLRKRDGMAAIGAALSGPVRRIINIPFPDPGSGGGPGGDIEGLFWVGAGVEGAWCHQIGGTIVDTPLPVPACERVPLQNTYDGWQYYWAASSPREIRRWNGTDDESVLIGAQLEGTFFGKEMTCNADFCVDDDGIHLLMNGSEILPPGLTLWSYAGIVRYPHGGGAAAEVGTLFSVSLVLTGSTGTIWPSGPICIWGGNYFTGSATTSGFSASATTESAGVYKMPTSGGVFTREYRQFTDGFGTYRFWAADVRTVFEPRGDRLWTGMDCGVNGRTKGTLRSYDGATWTTHDNSLLFTFSYKPIYAVGNEAWVVHHYFDYDTDQAYTLLTRTINAGGAWTTLLGPDVAGISENSGATTPALIHDGALRFLMPNAAGLAAYRWIDPTLDTYYEAAVDVTVVGMLVSP